MTGVTSRIIHSGLLPLLRNASTTSRRLRIFMRFWPEALQRAGRHIQQQADPAGHALEVPDVADRRRQFNVPHALAADLGAGHFHAAAVADDALEADALVLAAVALPVFLGPEDALAKEPVALRLQGPVVDG